MTKKCSECEKPMTKLEAQESEMGDEFNDDTICDECFEEITLEIAKGAFPEVFALSDAEIQELEFKLAHGVLMTRDEWETSIHLVNAITGRNDATSDEEYEVYAAEV